MDPLPHVCLSSVLNQITAASGSLELISINAVAIVSPAVPAAGLAYWLDFAIPIIAIIMIIMQVGPGHHQGMYQRPGTLTSYAQAGQQSNAAAQTIDCSCCTALLLEGTGQGLALLHKALHMTFCLLNRSGTPCRVSMESQ